LRLWPGAVYGNQFNTNKDLFQVDFFGNPANVPKRDKPNRETQAVWSAQGGAAQFIGRAEAKMVFGAVPQRKVEDGCRNFMKTFYKITIN